MANTAPAEAPSSRSMADYSSPDLFDAIKNETRKTVAGALPKADTPSVYPKAPKGAARAARAKRPAARKAAARKPKGGNG